MGGQVVKVNAILGWAACVGGWVGGWVESCIGACVTWAAAASFCAQALAAASNSRTDTAEMQTSGQVYRFGRRAYESETQDASIGRVANKRKDAA